MDKVLGLGNALVDILATLPSDDMLNTFELPKGSMQLVDAVKSKEILEAVKNEIKEKAAGGSAANTINGLANLGVETGFIGKVGPDELGTFFEEDLKNNKINPLLLKSETETGRCAALISEDTERTMATYLGAAVEMIASDLKKEFFEGYNYFHVEGYLVQNHVLIKTSMAMAKESGLKVSLDLAAFNVVEANYDFLHEMVDKYVDIVFANEEEAKAFTGLEDPKEAAKTIGEKCEIAVVKTGEKGSVIYTEGEIIHTGIINVHPADTTGAGDLYASGFLYGLIMGKPLNRCGQIAAITAGNVVEVIGPKMNEERWDKIRKLIKIV